MATPISSASTAIETIRRRRASMAIDRLSRHAIVRARTSYASAEVSAHQDLATLGARPARSGAGGSGSDQQAAKTRSGGPPASRDLRALRLLGDVRGRGSTLSTSMRPASTSLDQDEVDAVGELRRVGGRDRLVVGRPAGRDRVVRQQPGRLPGLSGCGRRGPAGQGETGDGGDDDQAAAHGRLGEAAVACPLRPRAGRPGRGRAVRAAHRPPSAAGPRCQA